MYAAKGKHFSFTPCFWRTLKQHLELCVFVKWACDRLTEVADFGKKKVIVSDEARFDLGGHVNKQNCPNWGTENPHAYIENPTHPKRVTVWCGFWSRGIIGPFFFKNEQGDAVTVNGDHYRTMLNEFLFTKIEEQDIANIWFSTERRYMPFSRSYTRCFALCFWRSHYQPHSWCRLATSELRFDTIGLLFKGCRQR